MFVHPTTIWAEFTFEYHVQCFSPKNIPTMNPVPLEIGIVSTAAKRMCCCKFTGSIIYDM